MMLSIKKAGQLIVLLLLGNIRGARSKAKFHSDLLGEIVYINDCETEDIVDVIFPENLEESNFAK